ncbi:hypothetical protein, partial [Vibrio parahaemolyticus]|uniref:hypothetical protein n=1 Tax=Vibrio parahaemolyticus TaxID=670 RepID=UPI0021129A55
SPTEEATRAAMAQYGVTEADIQRATGKSLADYFPVQGGLSTVTAAPVTGGLSILTPTADVSLTSSGAGDIAPIGSEAYRSAIG